MIITRSILLCLLISCFTADTDGTCPDDMQLFKRPDGTLDCLYCRECPAGTLKTKNCSLEDDTHCTKCYRSAQLGDVNNTCNPCSICEPGSYVETICTKFDDTVCTTCPNGTFSVTQNAENCSECGNCTGEMITIAECSNSTDVVCMREEVPLETADVIAFVAAVLELIAIMIVVIFMIIRHRKKLSKRELDSTPEGQEMITAEQSQGHETETDITGKKQAENKQRNKTKDTKKFNDFKTNVGVLVVNGDRKHDKNGKRSQEQTRPILVLRIGKDFGMTALQALKSKISQSEHEINFTKPQADNVYIEFHAHENVIKYRISSNTPVFEDVDLDIVILEIKQDDSEPSPIHETPVLKFTTSDRVQESDLQILDYKAKPSNGKGRDFIEKNVFLPEGYKGAMNILENVIGNASLINHIQDINKRDFDISINELVRNIFTKDSKQFKYIFEVLRNNEKLNEFINNPTDPEDVTTVFVSGQYSSGCPGYTYDDSGNLLVYCILTHRVPKIIDVLTESDQNTFVGVSKNVTAGTKITAIYKALKKANQRSLIKAVFESRN